MLYRLKIGGDDNCQYKNRWLDTWNHRMHREAGRIAVRETCSRPSLKSLWERFLYLFNPPNNENGNLHISQIAGSRCVSMSVGSACLEFELDSMNTLGKVPFDDELVEGGPLIFHAEPHVDKTTGEWVTCAIQLRISPEDMGLKPEYVVFSVMPDTSRTPGAPVRRRLIRRISTEYPSPVHTIALTEKYIVMIQIPYPLNWDGMLNAEARWLMDGVYEGNLNDYNTWQPERPTTIRIINRVTGEETQVFETDPRALRKGTHPDTTCGGSVMAMAPCGDAWPFEQRGVDFGVHMVPQHVGALSVNLGQLEKWRRWPRLATPELARAAPQAVLSILHAMQRARVPVNSFHRSAAIAGLARGQLWQEALAVADGALDVVTGNAALGACEKASLWPTALALLDELVLLNHVDVISYNTCISACAKNSEWSWAQVLLDRMPTNKLAPDRVTFNSAMLAFARAQRWQASLHLFEELPRQRLAADEFSVTAAIHACEAAGAWQLALAILQETSAPTQQNWNAAISACEKGRQWQRAIDLLLRFPAAGLRRDVISYNAAISGCAGAGQWPAALDLLSLMCQDGCERDVVSFSAAISACEDRGQWQLGLLLLSWMQSIDIRPNEVSCGAAISACRAEGQWQIALGLLFDMSQLGLHPNRVSCNAAMAVCESAGEWQWSLWLLSLLGAPGDNGMKPSEQSFGAVISACAAGSEWQRALLLFESLQDLSPDVDRIAWSAAVTACEKGAQWQLAVHFLSSMVHQDISPDVIVCNAVLSSCEKASYWTLALHVLRVMPDFELTPNDISFNAALHACYKGQNIHGQTFAEEREIGLGVEESRGRGPEDATQMLSQSYGCNAFFFFHIINAFEEKGGSSDEDEIVNLDVVCYNEPPVGFPLRQARSGDVEDWRGGGGEVRRFAMNIRTGECTCTGWPDNCFDEPKINPKVDGVRHRYSWGVIDDNGMLRLTKQDHDTHAVMKWEGQDVTRELPWQPVFVPEPYSNEEDAGAVLSFVRDQPTGDSFCVVLNAKTMEEQARIHFPAGHHVPLHGHGAFFSGNV
ncbi:unnamed protein product [Symbiodinium natans]|uniref:Pentatricopeptide repeat-containing protein, chloroplastic n=1 Tax=Symbiodinium natans TaxID=878477 RepID=A0A812UJ95_9DINO|nr:unnamed protein product [Symbiodinium natans]